VTLQGLQSSHDLRRLQPVAVVDINESKHDDSLRIDDVGCGDRQDPAVIAALVRKRMAETCVEWPQLFGQIECDSIRLGRGSSHVAENRKCKLVLFGGGQALVRSLGRDGHQLRTEPPDFGSGALQSAQLEIAIGAPATAIKAHNYRTFGEEIAELHIAAARIWQPEVWRRVAGLDGALHNPGSCQFHMSAGHRLTNFWPAHLP
jgi:hypothetical protein